MPTACWSSKRRVFNTLELEVEPETNAIFNVNPTAVQEDVEVTDGKVAGTLKYYDGSGWTAGTWTEDEKAGNFLMLKFDAVDGATIKVGLVPSKSSGFVTLDADKNAVFRVSDSKAQKLHVRASKDGVEEEQIYSLAGMTVESE